PLPDARDERFASEVVTSFALLRELALHDVLRRYPGVVGPRLPERVVTLHPAHSDDYVVQSDVEGVPQMELAGDVGGRDNYRKDRPRTRRVGFEIFEIDPALKPALFGSFWIEGLGEFQADPFYKINFIVTIERRRRAPRTQQYRVPGIRKTGAR